MSAVVTLLSVRAALQDYSDGKHPSLASLDRLIARYINVRVFVAQQNSAPAPLSEVMGDDDAELARVLDQLSKGNLATGGGGAQPEFVVEKV